MSINKWRYVEYEDDGVCRFQCLNCYETWTSRGEPGYRRVDQVGNEYVQTNIYVPIWHYCPFCGTKWEGTARCDSKELGPRRTRIREAIERREDAQWRIPYDVRRAAELAQEAARKYWLIEEKYTFTLFSRPGTWEEVKQLDRSKHSAKDARDYMRRHREMQLIDHAEDVAEGRCTIEHRVRAT